MFNFTRARLILTLVFVSISAVSTTLPVIPQSIAGVLTKNGQPVADSQTLVLVNKNRENSEFKTSSNKDGTFVASHNISLLDLIFSRNTDQTICVKDLEVVINNTIGCVPERTIATTESVDSLKLNPDKIKTSFSSDDLN
jgi:hypothetical protein